uniref:Interferon-upsilon n=1 Tax=Xenopus laevis TaxID=8355 RepID=A0A8K1IAV1_XENLA|nr:interferon-upsilon [Xenopus laevis]
MLMSQILRLLALVCLLNEGLLTPLRSPCISEVNWNYILDPTYEMEKNFTLDCPLQSVPDLCQPHTMLSGDQHQRERIVQILNESVRLFKKKNSALPQIFKIRYGIYTAQKYLQKPVHHSGNRTVHACFEKAERFLANESHSRCAWEKVVSFFREIIQRIENWSCHGNMNISSP